MILFITVSCSSATPPIGETPASVLPSASTVPSVSTSASPAPPSQRVPVAPGTTAFVGDGLVTTALGPLSGEIAFVIRPTRFGPDGQATHRELWAVPLDGRQPVRAALYRAEFDARMADTNILARQFSPDGRRIVLSVVREQIVGVGPIDPVYQLVVLELETGTLVPLLPLASTRAHGRSPAWSPDGRRIAFSRRAYPTQGIDGELWVAAADGTGAKRLWAAAQGAGTTVWGWTADSRRIGFDPVGFEWAGYALIDLDGNITRVTDRPVTSRATVSWRDHAPVFVGSFGDTPFPQSTDLLLADSPGGPTRVVASQTRKPDNSVVGVTDPRWDPSGRDVLIYQQTGVDRSTIVLDIAAGTSKSIGSRVKLAEWGARGESIVTAEEHPSTAPDTLYVWSRDGRLIRGGIGLPPDPATRTATYRLTDLAVRAY